MNPWYAAAIECTVVLIFLFSAIIIFFKRLKNKRDSRSNRTLNIVLVPLIILSGAAIAFKLSHSISCKYNDWFILGNSIDSIKDRYGNFDIRTSAKENSGTAGYYLYTDNGFIMPDHLDYYYYMKYDESGVVYQVFEGSQPGG